MRNFATPEWRWRAYFPKWALIKRRLQKVYRICNCKVEQYRERLAQALREEMYGTALYNGKGGLIKGRGRKSPFSLESNLLQEREAPPLHVRATPELFRGLSKQEIQKRLRVCRPRQARDTPST